MMKETINLLGKILTNILTALYEPFGFSLLLSFFAMFFNLYAYEPIHAGKGWKSAIVTWYQKFKESVFFRKLFFLFFVTSLILFRTLLNRQLWMNPLSDVNSLSGGQQQRVAIARAIVNEPEVLLLDEPLAALDLKMRKDMQMELKEMHKTLGITFVYVTHDQEEALTLSDTIVVMSEGRIQQIGTPVDIYNEPINSFVADFIGESNILNGIMIKDKLVRFAGVEFECVDEGFGENMPVDVVVRPEDWYIFPLSDAAQITGTVTSSIFKGVHYEMVVVANGYEFIVQDYHHFDVGQEVGLLVKPFDIHIMKKERVCNSFEGEMIDESHVDFLGCHFECLPVKDIEPGEKVKVVVAFKDIILHDNEEDGTLTGDVRFILYKGDHYHLTVSSDWGEDIYVDTNDVWDNGDHVGISILPEKIKIIKVVD